MPKFGFAINGSFEPFEQILMCFLSNTESPVIAYLRRVFLYCEPHPIAHILIPDQLMGSG